MAICLVPCINAHRMHHISYAQNMVVMNAGHVMVMNTHMFNSMHLMHKAILLEACIVSCPLRAAKAASSRR